MRRLVLVGGSEVQLFVLEALARGRLGGAELTLIAEEPELVPRGSLPGILAGRHELAHASLDLREIATRLGARFIADGIKRIDAEARVLHLGGGAELGYDLASLAPAGVPAGLSLPGVAHHARLVEPAHRLRVLLAALGDAAKAAGPEPLRVVLVGAGALGVEAALAVRARLDGMGASRAIITLIGPHHTVLDDRNRRAARLAEAALERAEITRRLGLAIEELGADYARVTGGRVIPADLVLWTTAAEAPPLFRASGLPTDERGFLRVDPTLAVHGLPGLFAAGDTVTLLGAPRVPRDGTTAHRMGPVLARNLAAALAGTGALAPYRPRVHPLAFLDTGDGSAILSRGELALAGPWALRLKDHLDRGLPRRLRP